MHLRPQFGDLEVWTLDRDRELAKQAGKVLVVDEFGWDAHNGTIDQLKDHLNAILADPNIGGDLFWALRGRKDNGELMPVPGAWGDWWALYYPGRTTPQNGEADMRERVTLLSEHAAAMKGNVPSVAPAAKVTGFVTRSGSRLILNGQPFRFAGANLDYVNLASTHYGTFYSITGKYEPFYPSHWAIDNAFETLHKMGGTVARIYSAGTQGSPLAIEPSLDVFNEDALRQLDYVIKSAGDHGVRVDLVLVCLQDFYTGGREIFSRWRGGDNFFEEPVVSDFEKFVAKVLTRVNSYTGVAYRDDPAIFGWETDNEIRDSPLSWENRICSLIKKLDPNHLVINGDDMPANPPTADRLSVSAADIYVAHYYPYWKFPWDLASHATAVAKAGKVFIVEEYGWDRLNLTIDELKANLAAVEENPDVAGDMLWALRGYIEPGKPFPVPDTGGEWWAFYPEGIDTGANYAADMHQRALILEKHMKIMAGTNEHGAR